MRGPETPLEEVIEAFLLHRNELAETTAVNYRRALTRFCEWCARELERPPVVRDVESGTVAAFLAHRKQTVSAESARVAWVALRSLGTFLVESRIHHDNGEHVLRHVKQPKVKEEQRRHLTDEEMVRVMDRAADGENGERDYAIVMTLLGTGIRRGELIGLRLCDLDFQERVLHIRASTSKSVRPRDPAVPIQTLKALERYVKDFRIGDDDDEAPLFTTRRGDPMKGHTVKQLFDRLKIRTGIRDLCAHMHRHTWATNFNRSSSGSAFDLQVEGGWTTSRMVQRYTTQRPLAERRRAPSPFDAPFTALAKSGKRPSEMRPPQQKRDVSEKRTA
jgi:integrase